MDQFENPSRAFLAARVEGELLSQIGEVQRVVYEQVSDDDRKVQSLPKDALSIPIIDLGAPTPESLEAAQLAVDRAITGQDSFAVTLGEVERWPEEGAAALIQIPAAEGIEALAALRARLAEHLSGYGFEIREGTWRPHVPVSRVRGDGPDFDVPTARLDAAMTVRSLALLVQGADRRGRSRFLLKWERDFASITAATEPEQSEDEYLSELTGQLEARLKERTSLVRPPRRRLRAKDMEDTIDVDMDTDG